ncbi:hypothetical protein [Roseibium sp.]|uniref:hypothetical protein n=1 Tax=Roseibium sp. TaxID=1936156 RepID=UPI003B501D3A
MTQFTHTPFDCSQEVRTNKEAADIRNETLFAKDIQMWIGQSGRPLSYSGVEATIARTTKTELRRTIYLHLF